MSHSDSCWNRKTLYFFELAHIYIELLTLLLFLIWLLFWSHGSARVTATAILRCLLVSHCDAKRNRCIRFQILKGLSITPSWFVFLYNLYGWSCLANYSMGRQRRLLFESLGLLDSNHIDLKFLHSSALSCSGLSIACALWRLAHGPRWTIFWRLFAHSVARIWVNFMDRHWVIPTDWLLFDDSQIVNFFLFQLLLCFLIWLNCAFLVLLSFYNFS